MIVTEKHDTFLRLAVACMVFWAILSLSLTVDERVLEDSENLIKLTSSLNVDTKLIVD